jgi:diguanylate cyclase (GGDEF)-like protein
VAEVEARRAEIALPNEATSDRSQGSLRSGAPEPAARTMPGTSLSVLLVEDNPDDAELVREMLHDVLGSRLELRHYARLNDALRHLEQSGADCVVLDMGLPDSQGLESVRRIQATCGNVPIVILSGSDDEKTAAQAVQEGAQDYLLKRRVDGQLLSRAIRYAMERKHAELELSHRALHDPVTELPNRTLFLDHLGLALARSGRGPSSLAVLFLDLDRFKTVNDSLGHAIGDRVLVEVAQRILALVRPSDTVARFGGDEFMILCEDLSGEAEAIVVARRLNDGIAAPLIVGGHETFITASIGIAFAGEGDSSPGDLIRGADNAMYRAKERGGGYDLADEDMHTAAMRRLETEAELHRALDRRELRVVYQPQLDLRTGRVFGVEALVRWEHPARGLVGPRDFLDVAEETGMIVPIGAWVLEEACRQLSQWTLDDPRIPDLLMCVNVSPRQLSEPGFAQSVDGTLRATSVDPRRVCLEVTETMAARDPVRTLRALQDLKACGVALGLDDFGTGYSSLSVLEQYPIDILKIDQALAHVDGAEPAEPQRSRIVGAIVGVARALQLTTVAAGVEDATQLMLVRELGCDAVQGYHFARPDTSDAVGPLLRREAGLAAD